MSTSIDMHMVHVIAVYYGHSHPTAKELLFPFVRELEMLLEQGFCFTDNDVVCRKAVELNYVVCDLPALALIKDIKNPTGYGACTKCTIMGRHVENRMCYVVSEHNEMAKTYQRENRNKRVKAKPDPHTPTERVMARTNDSFRNRLDKEHHHPLLNDPLSRPLLTHLHIHYHRARHLRIYAKIST